MTGGVGQVADLELVDAGLGAVRDLVEPGLVLGLDGGQAALEGVYVLRLGGGRAGQGKVVYVLRLQESKGREGTGDEMGGGTRREGRWRRPEGRKEKGRAEWGEWKESGDG